MMFSGSVFPGSGDNYKGVGLEMVADGNNYFRFRTNPAQLDIRTEKIFMSGSNVEINTPNFFLGQPSGPFISGSNGIMEINSARFSLDSAGGISASSAQFQNQCRADMFIFRETKISPSSINADNHLLNTYVNASDSNTYVVLEMTGSSDYGGPDTGHFIRVQGISGTYGLAEDYPIGAINIAGYTNNKYVSWVMIENADSSALYLASNRSVPAGANIEILGTAAGNDDWTEKSWNQNVTIGGDDYTGLMALNPGCRVLLYKSEFDWRIQSVSEYNHIAPYFASGSHHGQISQQTAINADGDIVVNASADGLVLTSPGGTQYRVTVDNSGVLSTASI